MKKLSFIDIIEQKNKSAEVMQKIRSSMLIPDSKKTAPTFNSNFLKNILGVEYQQLLYKIKKYNFPSGVSLGSRRYFSVEDIRYWTKSLRTAKLKPKTKDAITITIANFKGGVGKTTTVMTLAQGLSLRGHNVLVIDMDPQGSLTTVFGILPDSDVDESMTILPLCTGEERSISKAIQKTYWNGIDLVCAAPCLFSAEFILPSRQSEVDGFSFWEVLNLGIDEARKKYDVILIDTPPTLSYITINALMAADAILMPLPIGALDVASSAQFWRIFSDLSEELFSTTGINKTYDFIKILLTKVDYADSTNLAIRNWIGNMYADKILPTEIPKTAVTLSAAAEFGTVYDVNKYDGNSKTYKRAFEAYDGMVDILENLIISAWN